jgi:hypothetical protein
MAGRDPVQLRGTLRWKWRRWRTGLRHGAALGRLPVVFGNAMPKAGSKLLFNVLRGFQDLGPFIDTGLAEIKPFRGGQPTPPEWINRQLDALRPGDLRFGYLPWSPDTETRLCRPGRAVYWISRDPRDAIVSQIFYATSMHEDHVLHDYLESLPDMEARIDVLIRGIPDGRLQRGNVRAIYDRFLPWLDRPEVCRIRFEDLVARPDETLGAMLGYLRRRGFESPEPDADLRTRLRRWMAPERSETFRKGKPGGWREHFTDHNVDEFHRVAGDLLPVLGYDD